MSRVDRRTIVAGLGATLLAGCAGPLRVGEEKKPAKGGIGGTGIVGTLTEFGSLILNGMRVETGADTAFTNAFGPMSEADLQIGDSLTIEAEGRNGALYARRVHLTQPLVGTVEAASESGDLTVMGVTVEPDDRMSGALPGDRVAVSGLWRRGSVVASRIDILSTPGPSAVAGEVGPGSVVGGASVQVSAATKLEVGTFITVTGDYAGGRLVEASATPGRFLGAAGPLRRLSIEGYLEPVAKAPGYAISGLGHSFDERAKLSAFADARTVFTGAYTGAFAVETGWVLPEDASDRRAFLKRMERHPGLAPPRTAR